MVTDTALEPLGQASPAGGSLPKERVVLRRPVDLPGVELWSVTDSARLWAIFHTSFAFCATERMTGPQAWKYRRRDYAMTSQSTMAIEAGETHVTTRVSACDFHVVFVDPAALQNHFGEDQGWMAPPHFSVGQIDDGALVTLFSRLWHSIEDAGADTLEREHHLRRFLLGLFHRAAERRPLPHVHGCERAVARARELIEDRYATSLSLREIAQVAGVSKYHLEHAFKARMGLAIHQYLKRVRAGRALQLIRGGLRLVDVAELVGFSDQAHMTRELRNQMGFTPGQLWRICRQSLSVRHSR